MTGTLRYMAPEVAQRMPYGHQADIYSFGVLMWQILSLKVPFENLERTDHLSQVVEGGMRPSLSFASPCGNLQSMIERCWSADIEKRPTANDACRELLEQVQLIDVLR